MSEVANDQVMNEMLEQLHDQWKKPSGDFKPPLGEYLCSFDGIRSGKFTSKKTGKPVFFIQPEWTIIGDPNLDGVAFRHDMITTQAGDMIRDFVQKMIGTSTGDERADFEELNSMIGSLCVVSVYKRGEYTNTKLKEVQQRVVNGATAEAAVA